MKSFISFFFPLSQHWSAFDFLFPFYNQLGWWGNGEQISAMLRKIRGDHLPLSMVTRETAECRGRTLPECQTSWVSTGASHFLMLFNSKNTISKVCLDHESVWCKCLCESSPTTGTVENAPQGVPRELVSLRGGFWDKWCPVNGYFSCCFYAQLLKMTEDFSLFDSICVIFIFQFFLKIIVYNLALFFFFFKHLSRRSQRPLATLGWRPKDFSLVSDCLSALWRQLVASLLRYWLDLELEVYQILGGPQGRLSKANTRPPSPAALTSYQNKVHWGLVPPPLEICLLKIPPFLFSGFFFLFVCFFHFKLWEKGIKHFQW